MAFGHLGYIIASLPKKFTNKKIISLLQGHDQLTDNIARSEPMQQPRDPVAGHERNPQVSQPRRLESIRHGLLVLDKSACRTNKLDGKQAEQSDRADLTHCRSKSQQMCRVLARCPAEGSPEVHETSILALVQQVWCGR